MAIVEVVRSGNWSDTSHVTGPWPGESTPTTKPGAEDDVLSGEFVVTIDEDISVSNLESDGAGYFAVTEAPRSIACQGGIYSTGTALGALYCTHTTGLVSVRGGVTAGGGEVEDDAAGIFCESGGDLEISNGGIAGGVYENNVGVMFANGNLTVDLGDDNYVVGSEDGAGTGIVLHEADTNAVITGGLQTGIIGLGGTAISVTAGASLTVNGPVIFEYLEGGVPLFAEDGDVTLNCRAVVVNGMFPFSGYRINMARRSGNTISFMDATGEVQVVLNVLAPQVASTIGANIIRNM